MPVIKLTISREMQSMRRDFEQMMDELFRIPQHPLVSGMAWVPAMDIYEDKTFLYVVAEIAGVDAGSLKLSMDGQLLRIAGVRKPPVATNSKRFFQMEVEYGPFERIVRLPLVVESETADARLENGLLLVRLPKKKARKVTIEVK